MLSLPGNDDRVDTEAEGEKKEADVRVDEGSSVLGLGVVIGWKVVREESGVLETWLALPPPLPPSLPLPVPGLVVGESVDPLPELPWLPLVLPPFPLAPSLVDVPARGADEDVE